MSIEDALFRAIRPSAEALVTQCKRDAGVVDVERIADQVLTKFRRIIELHEHGVSLRARLKAHLDEYSK